MVTKKKTIEQEIARLSAAVSKARDIHYNSPDGEKNYPMFKRHYEQMRGAIAALKWVHGKSLRPTSDILEHAPDDVRVVVGLCERRKSK